MHVQPDEQDAATPHGRRRRGGPTAEGVHRGGHGGIVPAGWTWVLRLDSLGVTEYVGFHGVCSSVIGCLGRESHNLWLGDPTYIGPQPTLTPESRHRFRFHRKPY